MITYFWGFDLDGKTAIPWQYEFVKDGFHSFCVACLTVQKSDSPAAWCVNHAALLHLIETIPHDVCGNSRDCIVCKNRIKPADGVCFSCVCASMLKIQRGLGYTDSPEETTVCDIAEEVVAARKKFPGSEFLLAALMEEVGELARAFLQNEGQQRVYDEAKQVACVALRIMEEGDSTFDPITI